MSELALRDAEGQDREVLIPGGCFGDPDWRAELKGFPHTRNIGRAGWAMLSAKTPGSEDLVMTTRESGPNFMEVLLMKQSQQSLGVGDGLVPSFWQGAERPGQCRSVQTIPGR